MEHSHLEKYLSDAEELRKLLADAYNASPKKIQFLDRLGTLPGVIASHQSNDFCLGYQAAFSISSPISTSIVRHYHTSAVLMRSYLVENALALADECYRTVNREVKQNPEKVMVKMVLLRLKRLNKEIASHNGRFGTQVDNPDRITLTPIRTKIDLLALHETVLNDTKYRGRVFKDRAGKIFKEMLSHEDIPDNVYCEAWNLFEVEAVMKS